MNATIVPELPRDLMQRLRDSDRATGGRPVLPAGGRDKAQAWLRRLLVDFDALDQHIALLQDFYDAPFRYSRPQRNDWTAEKLLPPAEPTQFAHAARLADDRVTTVADQGVEVLSDEEMAALLLNPFALYDLFDVIDDLHPERWMAVLHEVGASLMARTATPPKEEPRLIPITAQRAGGRSWARRSLPWMAVAAGLLLLIGGLIVATVSAIHSAHQVDTLQAELAERQRTTAHGSTESIGPGGILEYHVDAAAHTPTRTAIWNANYRAEDSPADNVRRIHAASDREVKQFIDDLRKGKRPDFEILTAVKLAFGPPGE